MTKKRENEESCLLKFLHTINNHDVLINSNLKGHVTASEGLTIHANHNRFTLTQVQTKMLEIFILVNRGLDAPLDYYNLLELIVRRAGTTGTSHNLDGDAICTERKRCIGRFDDFLTNPELIPFFEGYLTSKAIFNGPVQNYVAMRLMEETYEPDRVADIAIAAGEEIHKAALCGAFKGSHAKAFNKLLKSWKGDIDIEETSVAIEEAMYNDAVDTLKSDLEVMGRSGKLSFYF